MFEQSMTGGRRARPWTFSVSAAAQVAMVGGALLVPLLKVEALPPFRLAPRAPMPTQAVQIVSTQRASGGPVRSGALLASSARTTRAFTAPAHVPKGAPAMFDQDPGPAYSSGSSRVPGVPDGVDGPDPATSMAALPVAPPPAPRPTAVAAVPKPAAPVPVGGRVRAPRLIHEVRPPYPPLAQKARVSGTVRMQAILGRDGTVRSLQAQSGHPLLVPAALAAVAQWRYEPTLLNEEPVEVLLSVDVNFTLTR